VLLHSGASKEVRVKGNRLSSVLAFLLLGNVMTVMTAQTRSKAPQAKPPKPGLTSCAGKIEGRYAESSVGQLTMEFRSGKTTMKMLLLGTQVLDCWTAGKKIYLYMPGDPTPMEIDINDDGTLQSPMGELKKKGS
jgi:hypothetical protein